MISVLTITYKRHHLLEEAIASFLIQENKIPKDEPTEMVIINDNVDLLCNEILMDISFDES